MSSDPVMWLLVVAAAHTGFQLTVTSLVYPALVATPPDGWATVHDLHSRRIAPLVVLLYGGLVVTGAWAAVSEPWSTALVLALVLAVATVLVTGALAAPLHGRVGRVGPRPELVRRLLRVDRLRAVLAVLTLLAAGAAALTR